MSIIKQSQLNYLTLNANRSDNQTQSANGGATKIAATNQANSAVNSVKKVTKTTSAYAVNLSAEAQSYLDAINQTKNSSSGSSIANTLSSSSSTNANYRLNPKQQKLLDGILNAYKDAPFTQDTFKQIQEALKKNGIDSKTLELKEKAKTINVTGSLIAILNGSEQKSTTPTDEEFKTKGNNYIDGIISKWQSISTDPNAKKATSSKAT